MVDQQTLRARQFILEVQELANKYDLPYFIVTNGASAISNNGCNAVEHARAAHIKWEKENGIDPDHDWSQDISL